VRTLCLGLILFAALSGSFPARSEDKKDKKKDAPKPVEAGRVYTQADLERVIQESKDAPTTPLPPAQPPTQTALPAPAGKPAPPPKAQPDAPTSFGNDDLERMFGKVEAKPDPDPDANLPKLPDPMAEVSDWQGQREAAARRQGEAAAKVTELEAQVRDYEQRALAVRNPLLARPEAPPGLAGEWEKMGGGERAAAIDSRLAALRKELADARQAAAKAAADAKGN